MNARKLETARGLLTDNHVLCDTRPWAEARARLGLRVPMAVAMDAAAKESWIDECLASRPKVAPEFEPCRALTNQDLAGVAARAASGPAPRGKSQE